MDDIVLEETRKYIQWNFKNGDVVTWKSEDILMPYMTVGKLERFAKSITNPFLLKIELLEKQIKELKEKS